MRRFWSDKRGNIAILFGLTLVPLIGAVGAAVDYSMAAAYRTDLQKALDSAALAMSKVMPADQQTLETVAKQYVEANLGPNKLTNLQVTLTASHGEVQIKASGDYTPQIASIIGIGTFPISTQTEAKWSTGKVEIALVLDLSLSMNSLGRIEALRDATRDLIDVLEDAEKEEGDAKVAIAGFDGMVNVGYTHANAPSWIRWDWWDANAYEGNNANNRCSINFNLNTVPAGRWLQDHCENHVSQWSCQGANASSQLQCQIRGGTWVQTFGTWTSLNRNQWAGCVYDRNQNHDVLDTPPTGNNTYYPAARCHSSPPQALVPLNHNWNSLRNIATNLTPTGWTNITIGLVWGWELLSPTGIYTQGVPYDTEDVTKYIILMTDGDNTKNIAREPSSCLNNASCTTTFLDPRTSLVCDNIKEAGIQVYSIRLIEGNEALIRNCASDPSMYFDVQQSSQLASVFSAIGAEISSLHLSK